MKNNNLNKEEQILQDKLNELDIAYKESNWAEMQSKMDLYNKGTASINAWVKVASILLITTLSTYLVLYNYSSNKVSPSSIESNQFKKAIDKSLGNTPSEIIVPSDTSEMLQHDSIQQEDEMNLVEITAIDDTLSKNFVDSIFEISLKNKSMVSSDTLNKTENSKESKPNSLVIQLSEYPCLYSTIYFNIKDRSAFQKLQWKINGEHFPGEYQFIEAGRYLVSVSAMKDSKVYSDSTYIEVKEYDEWDFSYEQMEGIFNDFKVQFKTNSKYALKWQIEDQIITAQQPVYDFKKEGLFDVTAYAIDHKGCTTEIYKPVAVQKDFHLFSPDAFTPNDDGINDGFLPPLLQDINYPYKMSIYTVSGNEIFSSNQKGVAWNGKTNNEGSVLPIGTYIWKVLIHDDQGNERQFVGQIKIVDFD